MAAVETTAACQASLSLRESFALLLVETDLAIFAYARIKLARAVVPALIRRPIS